ncbi:MAG: DUF3489 domain-containing protein [Rhodocyclales bacterium]|nr:DUF3489 domain-containing protein [Rhodocyclales bacterium]
MAVGISGEPSGEQGWQAQTVRGAISGMVRKRLGYEVVTEKGADASRSFPSVSMGHPKKTENYTNQTPVNSPFAIP